MLPFEASEPIPELKGMRRGQRNRLYTEAYRQAWSHWHVWLSGGLAAVAWGVAGMPAEVGWRVVSVAVGAVLVSVHVHVARLHARAHIIRRLQRAQEKAHKMSNKPLQRTGLRPAAERRIR